MVPDCTQHTLSFQSKKLLRLPGLANRTAREPRFLRISHSFEVDPVGLADPLGPATGVRVEEPGSPLRQVRLALRYWHRSLAAIPTVGIQRGIGQRGGRV